MESGTPPGSGLSRVLCRFRARSTSRYARRFSAPTYLRSRCHATNRFTTVKKTINSRAESGGLAMTRPLERRNQESAGRLEIARELDCDVNPRPRGTKHTSRSRDCKKETEIQTPGNNIAPIADSVS